VGLSGTGSLAASAASAPNDSERPVGRCVTLPEAAVHSLALAPRQRLTAAAISISRAAAPVWRITAEKVAMLSLLPVNMKWMRGFW
jgi:hypothetical protein